MRGIEIAGITALRGAESLARLTGDLGLGQPKIYKTVGEMAPEVDCIAIYAPNFTRIELMEEIISGVKAGANLKGVICEKPLGRTVAEARSRAGRSI
jgi:predicted dehydrogenase